MSSTLPASQSGQASTAPPISHQGEQLQQAVDQAHGASVHTFDPTASPSEKAAQARKAAPSNIDLSAALPKEVQQFKQAGGSAVPSDIGASAGKVGTTTSLGEVERVNQVEKDKAEKEEGRTEADSERAKRIAEEEGRVAEDGSLTVPPGALPEKEGEKGKVREIPSWFAIGWTGQDKTLFLSPEEAKERSVLADFVSDAWYGQWYHNAGLLLFSVLSTHFLTLLGGGFGWMIVILAICATYYETSIKRVRRNARDDMAREVVNKGLRSDVESAGWINSFMQRFWLIYEPVLSATIVASVDQVLSVSTPGFLDSIRMTTFTLGTKPPHIDHVKTFPDTEDDVVMMEWKLSFTPNDLLDLTHREAQRKVNPKIVLEVRIGAGMASVGKDIVVEDLMFQGTMRVRLKLVNNFPHVQTVDLSFMSPPEFDFVLKPVGFDLSMIPGLSNFITSTVHSSLAPMMYHPNSFTLNLEQMLSGAPIDTAVGVLAVTVHSAKGLKGTKLGGGAPDPYVSFALSGRAELAKSKVKRSTSSPHWNETHHLLLNTLTETLTLTLFDYNETRKDSDLGTVSFDLSSLAEDAEQVGLTGEVVYDGKPRGQVRFDLQFYPVLKPVKGTDGTVEPVPETTSGVVRLVVHQAKELDPRGTQINPFFRVTLNNAPVHRSQTLKRTPNPIWERPVELLVTQKTHAVIGIQVLDDNTLVADSKLGNCAVKLVDIIEANANGNDWFPLSNARSGKVRITAEWKPVLMAGAINGAGAYTPPLGVVRLWFKRSRDLKNVEALTGGKSDPYVRVLHGGIVVARTVVHNNNLDPDYDEIIYVQVHSPRDVFVLEVMDYQHLTKDRSLGSTEFSVQGLLQEGPDKQVKPWIGTGKLQKKEMLRSDGKRSVKGSLEFDAEFFPCANLKNVSFTPPAESTTALGGGAGRITELAEEEGAESGSSERGLSPAPPITPTTTTASFASPPTSPMSAKEPVQEEEGVTVPREELLKTQTGVLAFQVISGQLGKKGARLEVLFDDGYWPAFSTEASRSTHNTWDEIGEVLIRELDFSQIHLALNTAEKDTRSDIIAQTSIDMNQFLEQALDRPATFSLPATDGSGARSTVQIMAKYIPVDMQILPRESINNSGLLRVDLLDGKGLPAADRNGKSDPYCIFELNDDRVFKSEVKHRTLNPVWNEKFECSVPSREAAVFKVECFDWDRMSVADKLGYGSIDLKTIEPFEATERVVQLQDFKTGQPAGQVRVRLMFQVAFLRKERAATSTMTNLPGRALTTIGSGAVGGVGAVAGGAGFVGKTAAHGVVGVGKGVGGVGRGIFGAGKRLTSGHKRGDSVPPVVPEMDGETTAAYAVPEAGFGVPVMEVLAAGGSPNPALPSTTTTQAKEGTLTLGVGQLTGVGEVGEKMNVEIRFNGKKAVDTHSHKVSSEGVVEFGGQSAVIKTGEGAAELSILVNHKKTFGDKAIASAVISPLWQYVSPTTPTAQVNLPIGGGQLALSLEWIANPVFLSRAPSEADVRSLAGSTTNGSSPSVKARSRFSSFGRKKEGGEREREMTPVSQD
ncbi:hypothetical protein JCM11641_003227 [Rhodosporidiobolus odoratus]